MTDAGDEEQDSAGEQSVSEAADAAAQSISDEAIALPIVPYRLVEKHYNKTTKLLTNSGSEVIIDSRNRWHDYEFRKPLFISFVRVKTLGFGDYHEFRFKAKLVDGGSEEYVARKSGEDFTVAINQFVKSISFKPPSIWFSNPKLTKVIIWGFYKDDISEFLRHFANIDRIKDEAIAEIRTEKAAIDASIEALEAKEAELSEIDVSIEESQASLTEAKSDLAAERQRLAELKAQNSAMSSQLETISEQIEERKAEIGTLTTSREDLRLETERANTDLKKLKENINLFPSEISGFVTQAGNDIRTYIRFAAGLIVIISALFIWVLAGAFDLAEFVKQNPTVNIGPLLLAKLPLAIVVSAIVTACYKIARVFIEEMLRINRQKLSLTQVSIIAKDVSQSSEAGLGFSDTEIYGLRLRTKMAMLGDHIKTFVPSDPSRLFPENVFEALRDEPNEARRSPRRSDEPPESDEFDHLKDSVDDEDDPSRQD